MTTDSLPARWVLLASAGLACLLTGLCAWWWPEWVGAHLFVPVLLGIGLPPVVALGAGLRLWWASESVRVRLDQVRAKTQELVNRARELELRAVEVVTATDDDEPEDTEPEATDPAERRRYFEIAHWHVFFRRLWAAGMAYGWDIRTLTATGAVTRVTTQPGWNIGTNQLRLAGYLHKDITGTTPLVTDEVWQRERLWEKVPCPAGEPPDILPPPYTKQQTPHETAAKQAGVVVEGTLVSREE